MQVWNVGAATPHQGIHCGKELEDLEDLRLRAQRLADAESAEEAILIIQQLCSGAELHELAPQLPPLPERLLPPQPQLPFPPPPPMPTTNAPATAMPSPAGEPPLAASQGTGPTGPPLLPPAGASTMKAMFLHYYEACRWEPAHRCWILPTVAPWPNDIADRFVWPQMLGATEMAQHGDIVEILPTFFAGETDSNRGNRPRMDIVISFRDGVSVRYHPRATLVWSNQADPTALAAVTSRRNRYRKMMRGN